PVRTTNGAMAVHRSAPTTQTGTAQRDESSESADAAPSAPAPTPSDAQQKFPVGAASSEAVTSPPPPAPAVAEQKSEREGAAVSGNLRSGVGIGGFAPRAKTARPRPVITVIATPDPDVLYRLVTTGYVEFSDNGGKDWKAQLINPSAEFI